MSKPNLVYVGFGANLGNRQGNILQALQYIQSRSSLKSFSSFYETEPVVCADQPKYLNAVCALETELSPSDFLQFIKWVEKKLGRPDVPRSEPRPIDIDILFFGDQVIQSVGLNIPHPRLAERAFVLVPLAEIAPELVHPGLGISVAELSARVGQAGVEKVDRSLRPRIERDVQQDKPAVSVGLSRAGVTGLRRIIKIGNGGVDALFYAEVDLFVDLNPEQAGVHMSRFSDVVESLTEELTIEVSPDIESLAERLVRQVLKVQGAMYSDVRIRAQSPMTKLTPTTGKRVEQLYTLIGMAAATREGSRRLVGVEVDGMTVCPCAQEMVETYCKDMLWEEGFSEEQTKKIFDILPTASHNQRGRGTLLIGSDKPLRAENLVHIVEASMSSEIYELLKRSDEFFVVNKAHRNPKFVEDVVREVLRNVVDVYPDLPDDAFVLAKQENLESIHQHNAYAERYGTIGEIRGEIAGSSGVTRQTTLEEWLNA